MAEQTSRLAIIIDSTGAERNADSLASALGKMTQAGNQASNSASKVKKATKEEADALSDLLDRIDPVNAALNKLDKQQRELSKFKAKDMIDDETFDAYSKKIEVTRNRLTGFSDQLNKTGMSAKQTAAAMRMVPAQLTDIVVSLQGGQAPLTVLLQQGGQLKDMFGGIVPAAKALGSYVLSLANPFTVSAAAVGVLTYAIYQNRQEIEAASKIATTSLGANGEQAERLALNMVAISEKTGQAIDEVGNMFITTNDGASEAINKLIDVGYGYDSAREEVEKYKNSGNFTALNADIDKHRREILKIGDAWSEAAIKEKNRYTGANVGRQSVALGGAIDYSLKFIEQGIDLQSTMNALRIAGNKEVAESVSWINKEYLATDRVAGAEDRLKQARAQAKKIAASGNQEAINQANNLIALREKEVEQAKKAQEPRAIKGKAYTEDAGTRLLDQIRQQTSAMQAQYDATDKVSSATQKRIKFEQQIADLKSKSQLTSDQKSILAMSDQILQAYKLQESLSNQVQTLDDYQKMQEQVKSKDEQTNDLLRERIALLEKARATGKLKPGEYEQTRANIYKNTPVELPSTVKSVVGNLTPTGGELSGTFNGLQNQYGQLDQAQQQLQAWLQAQEEAYAKAGQITADGEARMTAIRQQAAQANEAIEWQKYEIITSATQSFMDSGLQILSDGFGQQSAIYKAAFAASKAYAIAQSMVAINAGIAQAANGQFPANIIAMASVAAQTASIVSNIKAVADTGFMSGGYTGNGAVNSVAGVVHGKEYVFDAASTKRIGLSNLEALRNGGSLDATLSKPGFGTGNKNVSSSGGSSQTNHIRQVINMPQSPGMTQQEMDAVLKLNNKQLVNELSNQTLEGKGQFGKSLRAAQGRGNRMT